ncbi:L-aspartate 1-decarboxylase [Dyadobacter jejuensis]|uniref:Aspartate 1-decarboxylase n=2 Tax=Dyadobacter jejuensis TaxID=1082580 RepID=A0A316ASK6_9BACT|nr:L-aspartate 1-decarboxylase [Dyadobacter jejuensis]
MREKRGGLFIKMNRKAGKYVLKARDLSLNFVRNNPIEPIFNEKHRVMQITLMKSKIHRVKVTQAELNYVGSITIDEDLMDAAGLIENEQVHIVNNNNGERFVTYVITGERKSGMICLNGAAARKVQIGDIVIIIAYGSLSEEEAKTFKPKVVFPDHNNQLV